ncbi:hypothetical protein PRJ_1574 [Pseudomonas sp. XWY-1]|nr:hypothetical protein PRJ_1574 [Pseudomonas sp. XWY-1]
MSRLLALSRVNPLLPRWWAQVGGWAQAACRSGFTRERAGPAANFHPSFSVAAATVFAGKPAPTRLIEGGHRSVVGHRPPCRSGFTAKGPGLLANFHPPFTVAALPYSR